MKSKNINNRYNKACLDAFVNQNILFKQIMGNVVGYKEKKVPKYLKVKVPYIRKFYSTYGVWEDDPAYIVGVKEVKLFKIGTETIKEPTYKRPSSKPINFTRYGEGKESKK